MRNLFLILSLSITTSIIAQNREIIFEHGNLASVYEKAKKENKLIFIDGYTTWCGPCKWLAKNVFTNDTVADYFNKTFVNYKLDMEKGEGIEFAKKYDIRCYPTLLYIDANGTLVHRTAGAGSPFMTIADAKKSLTNESYSAKKIKYEKEGINESNINEYAQLLESNCLDPVNIVAGYIKNVKDEDLTKRNNWLLVRQYINDPESREIKHLLANRSAYENKFGKDTVSGKLASVGEHFFDNFYTAKQFNKDEFEQAKQKFSKMNLPESGKTVFIAEMNINRNINRANYYAMAASPDFMKYFNDDANGLNSMAWNFYENVTDKKHLEAAVKMAMRACELQSSYPNLDTYAAVLYKSGNYTEADKIATKAIEKAKADKMSPDEYKETSELQKKIKAKLNSK
ncbi:MAG: thioredoxin domain-containing protein [Bacteroidia bacterium]